mmetsp:Transcript_47596/g.132709  ORF Transcript_47596/g.132709 Transcript_47596/m.132709 type:complete len:200 (+) Transcript_47596:652-1251(+)
MAGWALQKAFQRISASCKACSHSASFGGAVCAGGSSSSLRTPPSAVMVSWSAGRRHFVFGPKVDASLLPCSSSMWRQDSTRRFFAASRKGLRTDGANSANSAEFETSSIACRASSKAATCSALMVRRCCAADSNTALSMRTLCAAWMAATSVAICSSKARLASSSWRLCSAVCCKGPSSTSWKELGHSLASFDSNILKE